MKKAVALGSLLFASACIPVSTFVHDVRLVSPAKDGGRPRLEKTTCVLMKQYLFFGFNPYVDPASCTTTVEEQEEATGEAPKPGH